MASKIAQDLKIARHGSANSQHAPKRPQHRPTGIWGYGATTRRQPRRRGAPGRPRGGWGEILSSDRVNVSRKLGGERELSSNGSYVTRSRASGLSGEAEGFLEGGKPEAQGKAMRTSLIASTSSLITVPRASGLHPRPRGLILSLRQMMGPMRWHSSVSMALRIRGLQKLKTKNYNSGAQSGVWSLEGLLSTPRKVQGAVVITATCYTLFTSSRGFKGARGE